MLDKIFNNISIGVGVFGGAIIGGLGGFDMLLKALVMVICLDYMTGLIKAVKNKQLSSQVGFVGILRKFMIFIVVAVSVVLSGLIGDALPIREIVIMFYITNECLSLLENGAEFIPIPEALKDVLVQIRDKEKNHV